MLQSEILELIGRPEGAKLEFKRDDVRAEKLAKEIVSFANMNGGRVLLGVEDDGTVSGITRKNLQSWIMDTVIGRYIMPQIIPDYEEIRLDDRVVAVVNVPMGVAKPYALKTKNRVEIYVRMGDTCQFASLEQQARLFQTGGMVSVEKMPVHGSSLDDLDQRRLQDYFENILDDDYPLDNRQKIEQLLKNRDLMVESNDTAPPLCTYSGLILFGKQPGRRLPQSKTHLAVYPGKDKDYDAKLDEIIDRPFSGYDEKNQKEFIEQSIPNRLISYLQIHISRQELQGMQRNRVWDFPVDAIRELVINAFAHRDYTKATDIEISVYADRMEVISPGALPNGMTTEKVLQGQRVPKNLNIVSVLRDYGFMEHQGMGIRRKVIPLMKKHNGCEPEFEATEDYFKVTLRKKQS